MNNKRIAICIYCLTRYRVPEEYEGRRVFCKSCGGYFNLLFEHVPDEDEAVEDAPKADEATQEIFRKDARLLLGNLAVKYSMISDDELHMALYLQQEKRDSGQDLMLGDILVAHKMIQRSQLNFLLSVQEMIETHSLDQKFGQIAVQNRFASDTDIRQALQEQRKMIKERKSVRPLGDILVEYGMITLEQRDAILVKQDRLTELSDPNGTWAIQPDA